MMDKKRVRETLETVVDTWLSDKSWLRTDPAWVRGQIYFAFMIGAITLSEKERMLQRVSAAKGEDLT